MAEHSLPSPLPPSAAERLDELDGLRGLAVLFVVFSHTSNAGIHIIPGVDASGSGKIGVWLFFVLSAWLLTRRFLYRLERCGGHWPSALADYWPRRFFRIFPLFAVVLAAFLFLGYVRPDGWWLHLLLARGEGVLWAIPVEFKYYAVLPVAVLIHDRLRRWLPPGKAAAAWAVLAVVAVMAGFALEPPDLARISSIALLPYLGIFLAGTAAALMPDPVNGAGRPWAADAAGALLLAGVAASVPAAFNGLAASAGLTPLAPVFFHGLGSLYGLVWAGHLRLVRRGRWLRRMYTAPPLMFFGRISFSLYLVHLPILDAVRASPAVPQGAAGAIVLALSTGLALLTWTGVERPGIAAGARVARVLSRAMGEPRREFAL